MMTGEAATGACARIEYVVLGMLHNNVYIVSSQDDANDCFVVDPSCEPERILALLAGRKPRAIVITHYHFDHTGAAAALHEATGAPVMMSAVDAPQLIHGYRTRAQQGEVCPCPVDIQLQGGEYLALAGLRWRALATPGHSPGSMCYFSDGTRCASDADAPLVCADAEPAAPAAARVSGRPVLISGDTLFHHAIGRVDFAGGSSEAMMDSLRILATLPDETLVLPGHGVFSSIAEARHSIFVPYLGQD